MTRPKTATVAGLFLCLTSVVLAQIAMGVWILPGEAQITGVVADIGYTFTGVTVIIGFSLWKWGRAFDCDKHSLVRIWMTKLAFAVLAMLPALFGCIYFHIADQHAERYSRIFAVLPPLVYLISNAGRKKVPL